MGNASRTRRVFAWWICSNVNHVTRGAIDNSISQWYIIDFNVPSPLVRARVVSQSKEIRSIGVEYLNGRLPFWIG
jgi:hypothetical protein